MILVIDGSQAPRYRLRVQNVLNHIDVCIELCLGEVIHIAGDLLFLFVIVGMERVILTILHPYAERIR